MSNSKQWLRTPVYIPSSAKDKKKKKKGPCPEAHFWRDDREKHDKRVRFESQI